MVIEIKNINLIKQLEILGKNYIKELGKQLKIEGKDATGKLIRSLSYKVGKDTDNNPYLQILSLDYLKYVDQGRKKGKMPPSKSLVPWVKSRGIKIKGSTDEQTAFVIARSIGIKGIKPINVISKTTQNIILKETKGISESAKKDMIDMINKIMK